MPSKGREPDDVASRLADVELGLADLEAAERALARAPVVKPRHQTFYGSTEFYVREPGGNVVGFAAF